MRIATLNLYQYLSPPSYWFERTPTNCYSDHQWAQKNAWIKSQLQQLDADIVGFQEVFSPDDLKKICAEEGLVHFTTVGELSAELNSAVKTQSLVALASKLPFESVETVGPFDTYLTVTMSPAFARQPIKACVQHPELGTLIAYVVHFKSKHPLPIANTEFGSSGLENRVIGTLQQTALGHIQSQWQRSYEAAAVYQDILQALSKTPSQAIVVLGDFNDTLGSTTLECFKFDTKPLSRDLKLGVQKRFPKALINDNTLHDSFDLAQHKPQQRQATYQGFNANPSADSEAVVLDYLLTSNAFNNENPSATVVITRYQVLHAHFLDAPEQWQSDHAAVCIEIEPRAQNKNASPSSQNRNTSLAVAGFRAAAGGVYTSCSGYNRLSKTDKQQLFWAFFEQVPYQKTTSLYAEVPVNLLVKNRRHSIEHIVPASYLETVLCEACALREVRYGALTNPFNFAICDKSINANRSSYSYDFDGDPIAKTVRVKLQGTHSETTGLDAQRQWIIPKAHRGVVARAVLYMIYSYDLHNLYLDQRGKLLTWAHKYPPQPWEVAYNLWIYKQLGITNPLINQLEMFLEPLSALINSFDNV